MEIFVFAPHKEKGKYRICTE